LNQIFRVTFIPDKPACKIVCRIKVNYEQRHVTSGSLMLAWPFAGRGRQVLYHDLFSSLGTILRVPTESLNAQLAFPASRILHWAIP
jgi:hypothetical protein